jgi:pimeloyl-ACP methyl ester carboxylesterase
VISYPASVGDTFTRVLEGGRDGPPIVFLHGVGARADRWVRNVDEFAAAGHHTYAFDLPGHGFATKGTGFDYTVKRYAAFVRELVRSSIETPISLVGTSLGGHIAARIACDEPELVGALVLVGSLGLTPVGAERRQAIASLIRDRTLAGIETKLRSVVRDPADVTTEWICEEFRVNNSPGAAVSFETLARYFEDTIDSDVVGETLASLTPHIPTLLVWGSADAAVPSEFGEAAHALLPGSILVILPGAGHAPYLEQAAKFNQVVSEFLQLRDSG